MSINSVFLNSGQFFQYDNLLSRCQLSAGPFKKFMITFDNKKKIKIINLNLF